MKGSDGGYIVVHNANLAKWYREQFYSWFRYMELSHLCACLNVTMNKLK